MSKYMLITVIDREILTEQFSSLKEAQGTMHEEMITQGKVPEELFEAGLEENESEDRDCGYEPYGGYANDGINHADYDWRIVEL